MPSLKTILKRFRIVSVFYIVINAVAVLACSALNVCSVDLLLKIGTLLMEMLNYERTLDNFIELLRKDEVCLRTICEHYYYAVFVRHLHIL